MAEEKQEQKKEKLTRRERHLSNRRKRCSKCKRWAFRTVRKDDGVTQVAQCRLCGHVIDHAKKVVA